MEEDMVNIFKSAFDNGKTYDDSKPLHSKRHPIYIEGQEVTGLSLYGEPPEKGYRCAKCGEYISERDKDATIEYLYKVIKEKEQELDKAREEGKREQAELDRVLYSVSFEHIKNADFERILLESVKKAKEGVLERVALETKANVCECGEKWSETDLGIWVEEELSKLKDNK